MALKTKLKRLNSSVILLLGALVVAPASVTVAQEEDEAEEVSFIEEVVVVRNREQAIIDTSNPYTAISEEDLWVQAPRSVADALTLVPSFQIDPSQGQTNNQFRFRGVGAGGTQFLEFEEDGIPIQRDAPDFWYRISNATAGVDVLRGGSSPIYRTAAVGAIVNFRYREGSLDEYESDVFFQTSDFGQFRTEAFFGGPVSERISFAVSGWLSQDDGIRELDFNANDGYNLHASLKYHFEDDSGHFKISARRTDEDNVVYFGVPLLGTPENPQEIEGGPDLNDGSLISSQIAQFASFDAPGSGNFVDNTGGESTRFSYVGTELMKNFGDGFEFVSRNRFTDATPSFSGYFAAGFAAGGSDFATGASLVPAMLGSTFPEVGGVGTYARAIPDGFFPDSYSITALDGTSLESGTVTDLNGDGIVDPDEAVRTSTVLANGNGVFLPIASFTQQNPFTSFQQDIELSRVWDRGSVSHRFAAGYYYMNMSREQDGFVSIFLTDLRPQAGLVNVNLTDSVAGQTVTLTDQGLLAHNIFPGGFIIDTQINAAYLTYEADFEKITLDFGGRFDDFEDEQRFFGAEPVFGDGLGQLPIPAIGSTSPAVLAIQRRTGPTSPDPNGPEIDEQFFSGTVGLNWRYSDAGALYGRYTRSGLPGPDGVSDVDQIELGARYQFDTFAIAANLFAIQQQSDRLTGSVFNEATGEIENLVFETDRESVGLEIEAEWRPLDALSLFFTGTFQNPELATDFVVTELVSGDPVVTESFDGNRIPEQPELLLTVGGDYTVVFSNASTLTLATALRYVGDRPVDFANTASLEEYALWNASATFETDSGWYGRLSVQNITNEDALQAAFGGATAPGVFTGTDAGFYGRPLFGRNIIAGVGKRF